MNAAAATIPDVVEPSPPAVRVPAGADGWIDLGEAAKRSGKSRGHLQRLCLQEWAAKRVAEQRTPPEGGKPRWYVREDADPKFARVKPAGDGFDLSRLPANVQDVVRRRRQLLDELAGAIARRAPGVSVREATAEFCKLKREIDGVNVSPRALELWRAERDRSGDAGLVDDRLLRKPGAEGDRESDPFLQEVKRLYLDQRGRKMQLCYDRARDLAEERGWTVCSYKTACRYLKRIHGRTVAMYRGGESAYMAAAPHVDRDYSGLDSNALWIGDHHRFDVVCRLPDGADGKPRHTRPWLTAWMDARSRYIVGYRIFAHDPNSDMILAAFEDGVRTMGKPARVLIDNGKDYDSFALQGMTKKQRREAKRRGTQPLVDGGVFGRMQVAVMHAKPYVARTKTIERFFGTVADRFAKLWETYCGNSPGNRPEDHLDQVARNKAPTVEELAASFADWLDADHHHKGHTGDGMDGRTPTEVHAAHLTEKVVVEEALLAELRIARQAKAVTVTKQGVRWQKSSYGCRHPELVKREGQKVTIGVDAQNPHVLRVYAADGSWICTVARNNKLPVLSDKQAVREAMADEKRDRKASRKGHEAKMRLATMSLTDRLYANAAEKRRHAAKTSPTPPGGGHGGPSLKPLRSPLEDQLPALQRALSEATLRPAVGAESVPNLTDVMGDVRRSSPGRPNAAGMNFLAAMRSAGGDSGTTSKPGDAFASLVQRSKEARS